MKSIAWLAASVWIAGGEECGPKTYGEILHLIETLKNAHPDVIDVVDLRSKRTDWTKPTLLCQNDLTGAEEPCQEIVLRVGNLTQSENPAIIISGAIHGDEVIGPAVSAFLLQYLVEPSSDIKVYVEWLLNHREFWIMPFANAEGFSYGRRTEQSMDPNRDFPYTNSKGCFKTDAAKAVDAALHQRIFSAGITFHGGMRSLTYNWGSVNHLQSIGGRRKVSSECPDDAAQSSLAYRMQRAAGVFLKIDDFSKYTPTQQEQALQAEHATTRLSPEEIDDLEILVNIPDGLSPTWYYSVAPTSSLVYPVEGGLEDWAYGGGWEPRPDPIGYCNVSYYMDDPVDDPHLKFPFFLIETDDRKQPVKSSYGTLEDVTNLTLMSGHIPRNMRVALKLTEMLRPEIFYYAEFTKGGTSNDNATVRLSVFRDQEKKAGESGIHYKAVNYTSSNHNLVIPPGSEATVTLIPSGCDTLNRIEILEIRDDVPEPLLQKDLDDFFCGGAMPFDDFPISSLQIQTSSSSRRRELLIGAVFDQHWGSQQNPDPAVPPMSHIAKIRLEEFYEATSWSQRGSIRHQKRSFFPREAWATMEQTGYVYNSELKLGAVLPLRLRHRRSTKLRAPQISVGRVLVSCFQGSDRFASICRVKCEQCSELSKTLGEDLTLQISVRRAHFHSNKNTAERNGFHLGQFPCENGDYETEIGLPPSSLIGRVLTLTAIRSDQSSAPVSTATLFETDRLKTDAEGSVGALYEQPDSILTAPLLCIFPPGAHTLPNGRWSPAKARFRDRLLVQSLHSDVNSGLYPIDYLISSLGYFVLKPVNTSAEEASTWSLQGKMCFPGRQKNRPILVEAPDECDGGSFQSHVKPRSMLNPLPGRTFEANIPSVSTCPLGSVYKARVPGSTELENFCVLSSLRTSDKMESTLERQQATDHLLRFIDEAVCSRAVVVPPLEASRFSLSQKLFAFSVCGVLVGLSIFQCLPVEHFFLPHGEDVAQGGEKANKSPPTELMPPFVMEMTTTAASAGENGLIASNLMGKPWARLVGRYKPKPKSRESLEEGSSDSLSPTLPPRAPMRRLSSLESRPSPFRMRTVGRRSSDSRVLEHHNTDFA
eukprot:Blabericola_migrator_1__7404@NODE_376_length_9223_cov_129_221276_g300_i0_p1_GENE_NODE_376_length_9223_cov_129_221276_g300_i0NODE_376_length_9223_cov_129_221276_g300_i0_p1_ORF_typecomplete_len1100_score158_06Peptidase_M14/PF00246_24/2_2e28AstE_AspA/PF04952_14/2e09Peptidase_M99/PF17033_5/0_059_NODE_376_length_9223_cov_129_221276_g300_i030246323